MKFILLFGRKPAISYGETIAAARRLGIELRNATPFPMGLLCSGETRERAQFLFDQLGGSVKLTEVIEHRTLDAPLLSIFTSLLAVQRLNSFGTQGTPLKFGVSVIPLNGGPAPFRLWKSLSRHLVGLRKNIPKSKWISSKEPSLSSVIVQKEKLIGRGVEFNLCFNDTEVWLAKTLAVQDFKGFSERDYGRPRRDDRSGLLPPKLARVLLNFSELPNDARILDPHCGSGTVLQEALLLGFSRIMGCDLSPTAVSDTQKNLAWLRQRHAVVAALCVQQCDATRLPKCFSKEIEGIVTEPFLGPSQASQRRSPAAVVASLSKLYVQTFASYARVLTNPATVVSIFPAFVEGSKRHFLPVIPPIEHLGFRLIKPDFPAIYERTDRGTLLYGRPQQAVEREITIWRYTEK